jgi:hypothetical protein
MRRAALPAAVAGGYTAFFVVLFWPVLARGTIFGDATDQLVEALPMWLGGHPFWQPLTMLGLPYTANPLAVTWYPPAALRFAPNTFDLYVLSAYVIAACGAFGLARAVTRSTTGAAVAGFAYALSGFMIGHAGHVGLIHPAAWVPWAFWALVLLRDDPRPARTAAFALAYALVVLAGQPDIAIYTLYAAAAYVAVARSPRFAARALAATLLGVAIAAVALLPGFESALASVRVRQSLADHVGFAMPLAALPFRLVFPYLLGQTTLSPYAYSAWNVGSFAETSDYVGLTTLVLAALGARVRTGFWIGLFVAALALSTGNDLGLGALTYHLPALNWLRAPGRYAFEVALAASVLAAAGVAAIERAGVGRRTIAVCIGAVWALAAALLAVVVAFGPALGSAIARDFGLASVPPAAFDPLRNAALWVPLAALAAGSVALAAFARRPRAIAARALLLCAVAADLASFAWFGYWNFGAFPLARSAPPPYVAGLRAAIGPAGQRVLGVPTADAGAGVPPNLNVLWNVASVRGYTNLALARPAALLRVDSPDTLRDVLAANDRTLDAAGVRYAVVPQAMAPTRPLADPFDPGTVLGTRVGAAAGTAPATSFALPDATPATRIALVSLLAANPGIAAGAAVADVIVSDGRGRSERVALPGGAGPARIDVLALPARILARRFEVRWRGAGAGAGVLEIDRLSLLDDATRSAVPITALTFLRDAPLRWRPVSGGAGDRIFENVRAFPRAWIVHRAVTLAGDDALAAIVAGRWDPAHVAILGPAPPALSSAPAGARERVRLTGLTPLRMQLDVTCAAACLAITSDAVYPGWSADVDGEATPIRSADYAFRAVALPAGRHRVTFRFRPWSTLAGGAVTLLALTVAAFLAFGSRRGRAQA